MLRGSEMDETLAAHFYFVLVILVFLIHAGFSQGTSQWPDLLTIDQCPRHWDFDQQGDTCFRLSEEAVYWNTANSICDGIDGGHLAVVTRPEYESFIRLTYNTAFWLGAYKDSILNWQWATDETLTLEDPLWDDGEPNDSSCGLWLFAALHDKNCNSNVKYLCQRETRSIYHLASSATTNHYLACPPNWKTYRQQDLCLKVVSTKLSWDQAREHCQTMDADLIVITNANMVNNPKAGNWVPNEQYWTGLSKSGPGYVWVNGEYLAAVPDYLSIQSTDGNCLSLTYSDASDAFLWSFNDCSLSNGFVCGKGPSTIVPTQAEECQSDWHTYQSTCYKVVHRKMNWNDGKAECHELGGDLAMIRDSETEIFLRNDVLGIRGEQWIGIRKDSGSTEIRYGDERLTTSFFHAITRDGVGTNKNYCLRIKNLNNLSHDKDWRLLDCTREFKSLCQKNQHVVDHYGVPDNKLINWSAKTMSKVTLTCPKDWTFSPETASCVGLFKTPAADWLTANTTCYEKGGHLLKVGSQEIVNLISGLREPVKYWIGLSKLVDNSKFRWHDGTFPSPDTFTDFDQSGTPQGKCGYMGYASEQWKLGPCEDTLSFICQQDSVSEPEHLDEWILNGRPLYLSRQKVPYKSVSAICEEYNMVELFLQSDDQFHEMTDWLARNEHQFTDKIWLKTDKRSYNDYRWADPANRVGQTKVWLWDSTGYACYQTYELHDCCTFLVATDDRLEFRLKEQLCTEETAFVCVDKPVLPSVSSSSLPSSSSSEVLPTATAAAAAVVVTPTTTTAAAAVVVTPTTAAAAVVVTPTTTTAAAAVVVTPTTTTAAAAVVVTPTTTTAAEAVVVTPTTTTAAAAVVVTPTTTTAAAAVVVTQTTTTAAEAVVVTPTTTTAAAAVVVTPTTTTNAGHLAITPTTPVVPAIPKTTGSSLDQETTSLEPLSTTPAGHISISTSSDTLQSSTDTLQSPTDTLQSPTDTLQSPTDTLQSPTDTLQSSSNILSSEHTTTDNLEPSSTPAEVIIPVAITTTPIPPPPPPTTDEVVPTPAVPSPSAIQPTLSESTSLPSSSLSLPTTQQPIDQTTLPPAPPTMPLSMEEKQGFKEALSVLKELSSLIAQLTIVNTNGTGNGTKKVVIQNKLCPCACAAIKFGGMPSPKQLSNILNKLQSELKVETVSLSSVKNKKNSAKDARSSSQSLGAVAVIFAAVPIIFIVGMDGIRVYQFFKARSLKKNKNNNNDQEDPDEEHQEHGEHGEHDNEAFDFDSPGLRDESLSPEHADCDFPEHLLVYA